jgi:hypothetical protein
VAANVGASQPLPANGRIELSFDRNLQPISISRQTFSLDTVAMNGCCTPTVAYDPVARIVTITPIAGQELQPGQSYQVTIARPQNAQDVNGVRTVDGATLAAGTKLVIPFNVVAATPEPPPTVTIDFCRDIFNPIFDSKCSLSMCHGAGSQGNFPAAGLLLSPASGVASTAVGRVSQGANTGPLAMAAAPSLLFGEDMPIVDPSGDPANSWMMYKLLLAVPAPPEPVIDASVPDSGFLEGGSDAGTGEAGLDAGTTEAGIADAAPAEAGTLDGGVADGAVTDGEASDGEATEAGPTAPATVAPVDVSGAHELPVTTMSTAERLTLAQYILGREMPFPVNVAHPDPSANLTLDELERVSLWIAQGAQSVPSCSSSQ